MPKSTGTNARIKKKVNLIVPRVRQLIPTSRWWKFKSPNNSLINTKFFKLKNVQGEGVSAESTSRNYRKNQLQTTINASGLNATYIDIKRKLFLLKGNRIKIGRTNQG
jgi:hypothetical protein